MLLETIAALERFELRFASPHPTTYVVPDTNVLLEYPGQLPGVDWFQHLAKYVHPQDEVRVVVPLAVVDELDNLKRVPRSSKRAKTALKQLYSHFGASVHARPTLHEGTAERGRVFVELLMEPPSHVRLPRTDDELVRVAERLSAFTQRKPVFVSYDTGAAFRVSAAELPHVRLTHRDDE
jgi:predicted ribonuclease YlaK